MPTFAKYIVTSCILLASSLVPQLAHAIGLGELAVYSAIDQPLSAEIELTSTRAGDTDNLLIRLASEEAFWQAGIERPFYLTKLKFAIIRKPDGSEYIQVLSEHPIREPLLNFLLDVNWPSGRLIREYTVMLDPPESSFIRRRQPPPAPLPVPISESEPVTPTTSRYTPSSEPVFEESAYATPTRETPVAVPPAVKPVSNAAVYERTEGSELRGTADVPDDATIVEPIAIIDPNTERGAPSMQGGGEDIDDIEGSGFNAGSAIEASGANISQFEGNSDSANDFD